MKQRYYWLIFLSCLCLSNPIVAQNLANRNLFVVRIGDGTTALSTAASPVFLDEYSPLGVLVSTTAMPVHDSGSNRKLTLSGKYIYEGYPALSPDGKSVCLMGYNAIVGTASLGTTASATFSRTVGIIMANDSINTKTSLKDAYSAVNARCAVYDGYDGIWVTGANVGVRYATLGATTSTAVTSVTGRMIGIFDDQLYTTSTNGDTRMASIGPGVLPIAGQPVTNLPGTPITGSPCQFFLADICNSTPGVDVLYIADNTAGIYKYSLIGGTWVGKGKIGLGSDVYLGLTGSAANGVVTMYATRRNDLTNTGGGQLVSLTDTTGINGTFAATPVLLATAAQNTVFRGISFGFSPTDSQDLLTIPNDLASFEVYKNNDDASVVWSTEIEKNNTYFEILRTHNDGTFDVIARVDANGSSAQKQNYKYIDQNPLSGTNRYRLKTVSATGKATFSEIKTIQFKGETSTLQAIYPNREKVELLVNVPKPKQGVLKIYDVVGKVWCTETVKLEAGFTTLQPKTSLIPGVYVAVINFTDGLVKTKLIKQ